MTKVTVRTSPTWISRFVLGVLVIVGVPGCKHNSDDLHQTDNHTARDMLCRGIDRTNLEKVIRCYYAPSTSPEQRWRLLSTKSQNEISEGSAPYTEGCNYIEATVLGKQQNNGGTYARVSVKSQCGKSNALQRACTIAETDTWISEQSEWRYLYVWKTRNLASKKLADGDYTAAITAAKDWLLEDPFSEEAYRIQLNASQRAVSNSGALAQLAGAMLLNMSETKGNILRALLSINPHSSTALFAAISYTDDIDVQKEFLSRFSEDDCQYATAVFNVALEIRRAKERLEFIASHSSVIHAPGLLILKMDALSSMRHYDALREHLTNNAADQILTKLVESDSGFGAHWAAKVGQAALSADLDTIAKRFSDYAINRDPTNEDVQKLIRALRKKAAQKAVQNSIATPESRPVVKHGTVSNKTSKNRHLRNRVNALLENSQDE